MEKTYTLKMTEKEMKNPKIKKKVIEIIALRLKYRKHDKFLKLSTMEYEIIRRHWSWAPVSSYKPNVKERFKNEIGKYSGKRCVLVGK